MPRAPYRRPALPPRETPRGPVVRRADTPDDIEQRERDHQQERYRAQSARVHAELEAAVREGAIRSRATGGALLAIGLFLSWLTVGSLGEGYYYPRSLLMAGGGIFTGTWLLAVGAGGASTLQQAPTWVKVGAVVTFVAGAAFGVTGYRDVLAALAY